MAIIEGNEKNFEKEVLKTKGKVFVDFYATWCGPCKMVGPFIEELSEEIDDVKFVSIDTDEEDELSEEYGIISIPTILLFKNGKEIKRHVGIITKEELEEFIRSK